MLHSPTVGTPPWRSSASVMIPEGFVKLMIHAPGARSRTRAAIPRRTGIVRSALANPPAPVVSCPMQPWRRGDRFVAVARLLAAHAHLRDDERRAGDRLVQVERVADEDPGPGGHGHAPAEAGHGFEAGRVDVLQDHLGQAQFGLAREQPFEQFGGVGRASTDDGNLHGACPPKRSAPDLERGGILHHRARARLEGAYGFEHHDLGLGPAVGGVCLDDPIQQAQAQRARVAGRRRPCP